MTAYIARNVGPGIIALTPDYRRFHITFARGAALGQYWERTFQETLDIVKELLNEGFIIEVDQHVIK